MEDDADEEGLAEVPVMVPVVPVAEGAGVTLTPAAEVAEEAAADTAAAAAEDAAPVSAGPAKPADSR